MDDTPAPNTYFGFGVPSSLDGPQYSFGKLPRSIKASKILKHHRNSLEIPKVSLEKYKTDKVIDRSLIKERRVVRVEVDDRQGFIDTTYKPTTPSFTFKKLNPLSSLKNL